MHFLKTSQVEHAYLTHPAGAQLPDERINRLKPVFKPLIIVSITIDVVD
jgi:hypothetical protein